MANSTTLRHVGTRPSMRKKAGAMAHHHSVASKNVAVVVFWGLLAFVFFMGMVQVSNQVNGLRSRIAELQDRQEYLEANAARLLASWNEATGCEIITQRAQLELGLQLATNPAAVLLRSGPDQGRSGWQDIFQNFNQAEVHAAPLEENMPAARVPGLNTP